MAQYKVTSDRVDNFKEGSLVSEEDFPGANINALIEAGHLSEIGSKTSKSKDQPKVEE